MKRLTKQSDGVVGVTDAKDYRKHFATHKGAVLLRVSLPFAKKENYGHCAACEKVIKMAEKKHKDKVLAVINPRDKKYGYWPEIHVVAVVDKSYQTP